MFEDLPIKERGKKLHTVSVSGCGGEWLGGCGQFDILSVNSCSGKL